MTVPFPFARAPFERIVVGIDGSPEAIEAARQAARLAPGRPIRLVCAVDPRREPAADLPALAHLMRSDAREALASARDQLSSLEGVGALETTIEEGLPADVLRYATADDIGTLVALGTRRTTADGRLPDIRSRWQEPVVLAVVRALRCSVLVARAPRDPARFPQKITVGIDGSPPSVAAHAVARLLASATGAKLRCIVALGGKPIDLSAISGALPSIPLGAVDCRRPLDALLAAALRSEIVVVGNRGLHGPFSLGSVSERLVARAASSVLVVRLTPDSP